MPQRVAAAAEIREWLSERTKDLGVAVDSVSARAKDIRSARGKIREKGYRNPKSQLTDMIGARTVLLFDSEVPKVTTYLRSALDISEHHSRIAGEELELDEFGYRSVHLIARFKSRGMSNYIKLKRPWVEVQVRSVLQHAWAAIGHDHLYKSAVCFPDAAKRRFFAIAGGLELFDKEFDSIRAHREQSHQEWLSGFNSGTRLDEKLDITAVSAMLESLFPRSQWMLDGRPLAPPVEVTLMKCLRRAGIRTPRQLRRIARRRPFRARLETYAASVGTSPGGVVNFVKSVLAIGDEKPSLLLTDYEELIEDPGLRDAVTM